MLPYQEPSTYTVPTWGAILASCCNSQTLLVVRSCVKLPCRLYPLDSARSRIFMLDYRDCVVYRGRLRRAKQDSRTVCSRKHCSNCRTPLFENHQAITGYWIGSSLLYGLSIGHSGLIPAGLTLGILAKPCGEIRLTILELVSVTFTVGIGCHALSPCVLIFSLQSRLCQCRAVVETLAPAVGSSVLALVPFIAGTMS